VSPVVTVISPSGEHGPELELPAELFGAQVNIPLMHQVVVAQQAAARQGTHATRGRGAVRGGGRKPYRQKGTGRARQGSLRAPQYAGGGTVHGPVPRSYAQRTPKKMKAAALRGALSDRARHGRLAVVSSFLTGEQPSTRQALALLRTAVGEAGARLSRPVLVVTAAGDTLTERSLRNLPGVRLLDSGQLNTYDVLASEHVVFTRDALAEFAARSGGLEIAEVSAPAPRPPARARRPAAQVEPEPDRPEAQAEPEPAHPEAEAGPDRPAAQAEAGPDRPEAEPVPARPRRPARQETRKEAQP
jgi:large subunit ribosomal protein L4